MKPRAAITDEKKLGGLLRAIDEFDGWPTLRAALKFCALTFARPGEVRGGASIRNQFRQGRMAYRSGAHEDAPAA